MNTGPKITTCDEPGTTAPITQVIAQIARTIPNLLKLHEVIRSPRACATPRSSNIAPIIYRQYDNITLTNHLGGITINSFRDAPGYAMKNYLGYLRGESELRFWANKNQLA